MRKIYWCLQQLNNIGGTEMVTTQIISLLCNDFEIHLIPFSKIDREKNIYNIPDNVIIEDIGFPDQISQFDMNFKKLIHEKKYFQAIKFLFKTLSYYTYKRFAVRKTLSSLTTKEDILIFASSELMLFAPKDRFVVHHFHFNSKLYFNMVSRTFRLLSRKPDFYIFLTESTRDKVNKKGKFKNAVIYNPGRFAREENFAYHNNELISVCRFEAQKNPMLMVKIAKALKDRNFKYHYKIFGTGSYKQEMLNYIEKYQLNDVEIISGKTNLREDYLNSDLFIITSRFEGLPLTSIESTILSVPIIWMEMSDPTDTVMIENQNGFIIPKRDPELFADKIIEVLSNKEELRNLKERTFKTSERFMIDNIKNKWLEVLDNLFNNLKK